MKQQRKKEKRNKSLIFNPLFWILIIAAFLRFYKLSELFHWTLDEEFWSYIPFNIATGYHLPLIGGHISGTGLYSGPLFVWLMAIPFFLTRGSPIAIAALVSGLGVLTTALTYWVGKTLFEKRVGLVAALLSATSMLMVIYERKYWNASPIPLLSLLTILSLYQISKGKLNWSFVLASVLALAFHSHASGMVLLVVAALSWVGLKLPLKKGKVLAAIGLFLLLQSPLIAFELRHDFLNSRALIGFFSQPGDVTPIGMAFNETSRLALNTAGRLLYLPTNLDLAKELTLCRQYAHTRFPPPLWAQVAAFSALLYLVSIKRKKSSAHWILLSTVLVNFLGIFFYRTRAGADWYPGQLSEYFFFPSFPTVFLSLAVFVSSLSRKLKRQAWIMWTALVLLVGLNSAALLSAKHSDGFAKKDQIVRQVINQVGENNFSFNVEAEDPCLIYGYRYLLSFYGKEPVASYLDSQLGWLYERRLPEGQPLKQATILVQSGTMSLRIEDAPQSN